MSQPHPNPNVSYEPLPLTTDEHIGDTLYNAPSSPHSPLQTSFSTPMASSHDLGPDDAVLPPGAAQPRFLGPALYNDGGAEMRNSYASSHNTYPSVDRDSQFNDSVYGLNDGVRASPLSQGLYDGGYRDDPIDRGRDMAMSPVGRSQPRYMEEKRAAYAPPRSKRKVIVLAVIAALILLIAAVVIPVYFAVIKPNSKASDNDNDDSDSASSTSSAAGSKSSGTTSKPSVKIVTGGDGSTVTTEDGSTFTYANSFGGYWYWDDQDPFNNGARPQSWSPALNETFNYGVDRIRGVNLGGWLTLEPVSNVSPAVFEPYISGSPSAVDEYTLHTRMAADTANGGLNQLEDHYKTFITEQDFADIAAAGLNYVRIPIPYWAIEVRDGEPFLPKTCWKYFLKGLQWARKYGLRVNLDFHALPGSQNGWNHSGKLGSINVLNGPMGVANAQRSLDYIRIFAEFISQPQYRDVVTMFGITNEPQGPTVGQAALSSYYLQAYNIVRTASGNGTGPWVNFHDGFMSRSSWGGFLPNADRITLDSHPYIAFGGQSDSPMSSYATTPCDNWGASFNDTMSSFGLINAGEWSNAVTDCGLFLNGVNLGTRYEGNFTGSSTSAVGSCTEWTDWQNYDTATKKAMKQFAMASMDALQNWFFWTWKIGNSSISGKVESPAWSYKLGLDNGWMPTDPRDAMGTCGNTDPWKGPLTSGSGNIPASVSSSLPWPPAVISNAAAVSLLPTYTATGTIPTLSAEAETVTVSPTASGATATATVDYGDGWANPTDTAGVMVEIATCSYLDPWVGPTAPPSPLCS